MPETAKYLFSNILPAFRDESIVYEIILILFGWDQVGVNSQFAFIKEFHREKAVCGFIFCLITNTV